MMIRTYSELIQIDSFEERFEYLALHGDVGRETFGFDRYLNQSFYSSKQWRDVRHLVNVRDEGRDLAMEGYEFHSRPVIHHMNPMRAHNLIHGDPDILNPEYLITTTHRTHNAIHYGDSSLLPRIREPRRPGDTTLW